MKTIYAYKNTNSHVGNGSWFEININDIYLEFVLIVKKICLKSGGK